MRPRYSVDTELKKYASESQKKYIDAVNEHGSFRAAARAQGYREMVTDVIHHNVASINSLIACGFRLFVPDKPWGKPEHVCFWRRPL